MMYPVKIEFAKTTQYTSPLWEDWSGYLTEPPTISRKVESDNPGEAGLIVFDNASISLYYTPGNLVYARFNNMNLTAGERYLIRISAYKADKTYRTLFEGMIDFSTIEWPENEAVISFEVIDKLSALGILEARMPRSYGLRDPNYLDNSRYYVNGNGTYFQFRYEYNNQAVNFAQPFYPGDILCSDDPSTEGVKFFLVTRVNKNYLEPNEPGVFDPYYVYDVYVLGGTAGGLNDFHYPYYSLLYYTTDIGVYRTIPIYVNQDDNQTLPTETEELYSFDGIKLIKALIYQQWPYMPVINKTGTATFNLPLNYFEQLINEKPLDSNPLEALKFLANTMNCYLFINSQGEAVLQSRNNLTGGTARDINSGRLIAATRKYFWDKLVDGVNVTVKSSMLSEGKYLQGTSSLSYRLPGSTGTIEPKNSIDKEAIASADINTQEELDAFANQIASEYMLFYGKRHDSIDYEIELNDETMQWDLIDHILINSEAYFFDKIDLNLAERIINLEAVKITGADYDLRRIAIALSDKAYTSSGSGSSSYSSGYLGNPSPYLWDGSTVVNPDLGRRSLGLNDVSNIGNKLISNAEFDCLNGVTSNIQTQLNVKENILSFTDPLVRSGAQISITTGAFSLGANSSGFTLSGTGKPVGGDIALAFPQRLDQSGTPQFAKMGVGGSADAGTNILKVYGDAYFTGVVYIAGSINQVNVTDLNVSDKNIILNKNGTTSTASDAGLKVEGDSSAVIASLLYDGTNWTHSHDINTASGKGYKVNGTIVIDSSRNISAVAGTFTSQLAWNGTSKSDNAFSFYTSASASQSGRFKGLQVSTTYSGTIPDNGILFYTDTNLYRSAANQLKTDGSLFVGQNLIQNTAYRHYSQGYISGWGNTGFDLNTDSSGVSSLTVDNLTVRRRMSVYELIIRQVNATNGNQFVSASGKITSLRGNETNGNYYITLEDPTGHNVIPFKKGDLFLIQKVRLDGGANLKYIQGKIIATYSEPSGYGLDPMTFVVSLWNGSTYVAGDAFITDKFEIGDVIVRYGSVSDTTRQGSIYLASDDDGAPFIDIRDGVNSPTAWNSSATKVRLGNMYGIAGNPWGAQNKYGLYADVAWLTENVLIGGRSLGLQNGMTALFHFDDNLYDSISGIKPSYSGTFNETNYGLVTASGLTATKANGKFGGGVAVEEAVTNMLTGDNSNLEFGMGTWGVYYGITGVERSNSFAKFGSYSLKINGNGSANGGIQNTNGGARWVVSPSTVYTVSGYALSPSSRLTRVWIREYNSSGTLIANTGPSQITPLVWTRQSYTFTTTAATAFIIVDIYVYNLATGESVYWDGLQLEQKPYSTSFTEGSRAAGKLIYTGVINPSAYTVSVYAYIDLTKMGYYGRIIDIALDANNRLQLCRYDTTNYMQFAVITDGTVRINRTSFVLSNGWHKFTLSYTNSQYYIGVDGAAAYPAEFLASSYGASSNWKLSFGTDYAGSSFSNCIYDEASIWNRGITEDEDRKIYYSNQPLQESPGMTYISGNKIRTGYIYSENYDKEKYGMMIGLNSGYLEMNFGGANIFKFDSANSTAKIAGWNISPTLLGISNNVAVDGYIFNLKPQDLYNRPVLEIYWANGAVIPSTGKNSVTIGGNTYMASANGQFTTTSWDNSGEGGGLAVNVNGENILIAGKRGSVTGAAIAGWNFDKSAFWTGTKGSDGAYTTSGMTIGSSGFISAPNTFISSSGVLYSKSGNIANFSFDASKFYVSTDFVLDAANKKLYFNNKSSFSSTASGVFLGLDSGTYKFAIGSSTVKLTWDGTALSAVGANISGATVTGTTITGGTITGSTITGGTIQTAASGYRIVIDRENEVSGRLAFYNAADALVGVIMASGSLGGTNMLYIANGGHSFQGGINTDGDIVIGGERIFSTTKGGYLSTHRGTLSSSSSVTPPSESVYGDTYWEILTYPTVTHKLKIYTPDGWKTITLT